MSDFTYLIADVGGARMSVVHTAGSCRQYLSGAIIRDLESHAPGFPEPGLGNHGNTPTQISRERRRLPAIVREQSASHVDL
jgi:hypothetical protein